MGPRACEEGATRRLGLHRRVPARGVGCAQWTASGYPLVVLRRTCPTLSGGAGRVRSDLRARWFDVDVGGCNSRHRFGASAGGRGFGSRRALAVARYLVVFLK